MTDNPFRISTRIIRVTVDFIDAFDAFLDAQEVVVPKDEFRYADPSYDVWNEDFRWHCGLWRVLMDAAAPLGIWRYRVVSCDPADCAWMELSVRDSRVAEVVIVEFAENVFRCADWVNVLGRIRHN